ncbi:hypothetical protein [Lachnoanaerobaculum gingivalis]|jgi:hypothetical protein|uniref:hypothetical protein n=1 Tax=Lachnoanaerobaculum gingivalis TaxID=2490855 RepID=UPI0024A7143A|nr:hypothetical protein [Lachnoanaerobaculum gingivalis]WHE86243.1 hypothetical protein QJR73_08040 [Lachnoanaerobaculum gingivalis]
MVYLIVDKKNENDFEKINYYKIYLQNIYHDDVECIIEDNRVITPLGKEGEALEEKGRIVRKKLSGAKAVYLLRDKEFTVLRI